MPRHGIDIWVKLTARVPRGHQGFWEIIRRLREFTVRDVEYQSNVQAQTVRDFVRRLYRGGYIEWIGERRIGTHGKAHVYRLVHDQPEAPALRRDGSPAKVEGLANEQMWRTMRMLGRFRATDLAVAASTEHRPITRNTAASYCRALARAGYLQVVEGGRAKHPAVYWLPPGNRTGPLPPQIQRTKFVFDPNLQKAVGTGEPMGGEPAGGES